MIEQPEFDPIVLWSLPERVAEQDCACASEETEIALSSSLAIDQTETDCACSTAGFMPKTAPDMSALWQLPRLYRAPVGAEHELVFNPAGSVGSVAVLNKSASQMLDTFVTVRPLGSPAAHQLAALGILSPVVNVGTRSEPSQRHTLTAWLHITDACNLRCRYCYLHHSGESMNADTGLAALEAVFRSALRNGFQAVKLKYTGGEPALNFSLVRGLHERAEALSTDHGLDLRAAVLSNGTLLTDGMVDWLLNNGVRLMISLDGVGAVHDAQRPFADGRGSFAQIARNIDYAIARGLSPHLSITVTTGSAEGLADVVSFALERDLFFNLNFVREPGKSAQDSPADHAHLVAGVKAAFDVIEGDLPHHRLIDGLLDCSAFGVAHQYPCGARRSYLVIGPRGRVSRCQMTMDQPVTDIGDEDPLRVVREWDGGFQNVAVEEKEGCRDCTWRYWCAGGCPLLAYRAAGRSDVSSTYCDVYKALYPELLRLEGLRLLRWQRSKARPLRRN